MRTLFEFILLCVMCICRFPGMAMAAEYSMQPQEMSSPPPSSPLTDHKPIPMKSMSPKQREVQAKQILEAAGYKSLSKLVGELLTQGIIVNGSSALTLFAPSEEAFEKYIFQSMDPRRILGYHTVKGLFSSPDLARLPADTKLHTILPGHFLVVTASRQTHEYSTTATGGVWVEGVEISHPDIFNDGQFLAIHGIDNFIKAEEDSVSVKASQQQQMGMRSTTYMVEEAMIGLRDRGYSVLAVALRLSPSILAGLDNLTVFSPNDDSIFLDARGQGFMNLVGYHVLPNRRLLYADLLRLPAGTTVKTLMGEDSSSSLLVTTNSSSRTEGVQVSINYVGIQNPDAFSNDFIAVHGIPYPFPQLFATSSSASSSSTSRPEL